MPELQVPAGAPKERIDRALTRLLDGVSRGEVQRWIDEGRVQVGGKTMRAKDCVAGGDWIAFQAGQEPATAAEPDASVVFGVVFEDADVLVVDKPAGLVVHPARGNATGTLVNGLLARPGFERIVDDGDPDGQRRPGIVHRIDKDTSGILVVAKSVRAREGLKRQFADHSISRVYHALTVGVPSPRTYDTWYGRHPSQRLKFSSLGASGKRAVTHVSVTERLSHDCALIECRLETGRTHQIRVHLSEQARCPLLADALYGGRPHQPEVKAIAQALGRQALHAGSLGFVHPTSGDWLSFESPLPADFSQALRALRGAST
jgi:23S rRNA pseudouridine1911/1915/1917 synthase